MSDAASQDRERLALKVIDLAKALALADNHFLSAAVGRLQVVCGDLSLPMATNGTDLVIDPKKVCDVFLRERTAPKHDLLHSVMHCLFLHPYVGTTIDRHIWDLASDIVAECAVEELCGPRPGERGRDIHAALQSVESHLDGRVSAERLYRELKRGRPQELIATWTTLFASDSHQLWYGSSAADATERKDDDAYLEAKTESRDDTPDSPADTGEEDGPEQEGEDERAADETVSDESSSVSEGEDSHPDDGAANDAEDEEVPDYIPVINHNRTIEEDLDGEPTMGDHDTDLDSRDVLDGWSESADGEGRVGESGPEEGTGAGHGSKFIASRTPTHGLTDVASGQRDEEMTAWRRVSRMLAADLTTFGHGRDKELQRLADELEDASHPRADYADFLRQFAIPGEVLKVSDDEFDYVYYSYGLRLYGNLPLIEPLEYREEKRVREFVIVIDTSASVWDSMVRRFVDATFDILKSTEAFFEQVNVRILQCDVEVRSDDVICSLDELGEWGRAMHLHGSGGTDFRPAFAYVDQLVEEGAFENLGGLVYFTDGHGSYPEWVPGYKVAFVFYDEGYRREDVPPWAAQVVINDDALGGDGTYGS